MIIKNAAIGNNNEAFIEERFTSGTNIIFSNENNRGKTLLMQSLVYSLGYESIFPSGFNVKNYFFYVEIEIDHKKFEFLRKGNSILVLHKGQNYLFNSITEFKYYFDQEIYTLPKIEKDGELKSVDLSLLYEIFFLGQDKRNTSNLIVRGQNNKVDFINMIYSLNGVNISTTNKYDIESLKKEKTSIDAKIKSEMRRISIIRKNPDLAKFISASVNNLEYKNISNQLQELHQSIAELKKRRNREENRKIKLEMLINELKSLNRNLNEGRVKCGECNSSKIIFTNDNFEFEVSNSYVQQDILFSINKNIEIKKEVISELNNRIMEEQEKLNKALKTTIPEIKDYILFEDEITESKDIDKIVYDLQKKSEEIERKIKNNENEITSDREKQGHILKNILKEMKDFYNVIDPHGLLKFEDLFTKSGETYSGSEGQEYYFCRIMTLNKFLSHKFPIIIDSFREGELSTTKEEIMIQEFLKLNKQVILSSTLKKEEYNSDKYYAIPNINVIDYSTIEDSKLLQKKYLPKFKTILNRFKIS